MPKVTMKLPDDLIKKISTLGDKTDEICEKALKAGADVVEKHLKANLDKSIGTNLKYESRSTGQLKRSIGVTPVLIDKNGNYNIKIGVDDKRTDSVTNTMLANIIEYGKVGQVGDELKDTGKDADTAKDKFSKVASTVKGMAKAMGTALAAVGTATVAAGKKIVDLANETAEAGDTVDKQSQKMSMSAEDYQKLAYAAELSGTNMKTMQKAQKSLLSTGSDLSLVDALKQCADSSDVAATATELFGAKTAQELLPMLNQGSEGIEDMMNQALGLGEGFENTMLKVKTDMQKAVPTTFDIQANLNGVKETAMQNLTKKTDSSGIVLNLNIENFTNNTKQDIRDLANEISEVIASQVRRKGVAF